MSSLSKRATVYFDPLIHKALKLKAAETSTTISDLIDASLKLILSEDAEDLAAFKERSHEAEISFEQVLKDLQKHGKL